MSNINACLAVQATIKSTLGPYGGDLLMVDENGRQTITNDGATVMKLLDIVHPAARILVATGGRPRAPGVSTRGQGAGRRLKGAAAMLSMRS